MSMPCHFHPKMMERTLIHRFFLVIILIFVNVTDVTSLHTQFCIRFPSDSFPDSAYQPSGDPTVQSVGMEKFPSNIWRKYYYPPDKLPGGGNPPVDSFLDHASIKTSISLYNIQGRTSGSDEPLTGWFRVSFSFSLSGPFDQYLRSFILFATDEEMNHVGEFIYNFPTTVQGECPHNDATKYMLISCGGVSKYEPIASNVIVFARNTTATSNTWPQKYKHHWPIVPKIRDSRLNFYFRHSMQDANTNGQKYIIFRVIADPDEDANYKSQGIDIPRQTIARSLLSATAWFKVKSKVVPGAADPLPTDPRTLQCSEKLTIDLNSGTQPYRSLRWLWYITYFSDSFEFDIRQSQSVLHFANSHYPKTGCSGKYFGGRCSDTLCSVKNSGRPNRNKPSSTLIPQWHSTQLSTCSCSGGFWECVSDKHADPTTFNNDAPTVFHECLDHFTEMITQSPCSMTEDEAKLCTITAIRKERHKSLANSSYGSSGSGANRDEQMVVDIRGVRVYGFGTVLYGVRKGHGVIMTIAGMFFLPVSIFTTRYFKETFMGISILYSRVWFQIHLQVVFWMFALYFAGILLALVGKSLIGVSLTSAGVTHRVFGWLCIVVLVIISATGGIRGFGDVERKTSIIFHWLIGYIFYILNFISIMSSVYIPGCPSADHEESVLYDEYEPRFNRVIIVCVVWIFVEIVIGIIMTLSIYTHDKFMVVKGPRKFIPPYFGTPIPVIRETSITDASGSGFRFIIFWLYTGCAFLLTIFLTAVIIANKPKTIYGFGPMSCTHDWNEALGRYTLSNGIDSKCRYS